MKKAIAFLFITVLLIQACTKSDSKAAAGFSEMDIVKTITPASTAKANDLVSVVTCQGPDLCYRFSHFAVAAAANNI